MESILTSIKKLLGIAEDYHHFDVDITMHINDTLSTLHRLGVGPSEGFVIEDASTTWNDYISNNVILLSKVKNYIYRKVRLAFDPPTSSSHLQALKELIAEDEWRIVEIAESSKNNDDAVDMDDATISYSGDVSLTDRTTNATYELYVDDGRLTLSEGDDNHA